MYKLKQLFFYSFCFLVFSCNNRSSDKSTRIAKRDTVRVLAVFKSAVSGQAEGAAIRKVYVPDTLSWKDVAPGKQEMRSGPDSFYIISYNVPVRDSLGNIKKDSTGKLIFTIQDVPTDKKWIRSGYQNLDSAIKEINDLK